MKLIQSILGRRQFLIAAGVASTCALTCKKIVGFTDHPVFQTDVAMASEKTGISGAKATTNEYPHLLSPLRIRNVVLKNRILHTPSPPHYLQGPENYPADAYRSHYSNMAKNAAVVSVETLFGTYPKTYDPNSTGGIVHTSDHIWEDIPPVHNYIQQLIEDIHCEGSLVYFHGAVGGSGGPGGTVTGEPAPGGAAPGGRVDQARGSATIEEVVTYAKQAEDQGYDVFGMMWGGVRYLSGDADELNTAIEQMQAVRKATNLIIAAFIRPYTPGLSMGGRIIASERPQLEEVVKIAERLEGSADILRMKCAGTATAHPNSFTQEKDKPLMLPFARAIKESGNKIIVCPTGGFHDPALNDEWIASGKTDMVGMATPFFADPEWVKKAYEGRAEDIVPCIMCHDCHGISKTTGPWYDTCNVNPMWGLSETKKRSIRPPSGSKKVAVIGGGPGGMKAALTAAERGHRVTLYEKSGSLGGLLQFTDYTQWKWAYKDFKDYLIRQVNKAGIEVKLNTTAAPDMIKAKGYDTVLVATGAEPVISRMPGADGENVYNIVDVYSKKKSFGKNVVIIGAGRIGTETGICLAKDGYKVTVLTSGKEMIEPEFIGPHNMLNQEQIYKSHPNFSYFLEATVKNISGGKVIYADAAGSEKSLQADSVVIYAGLKPRMDEAMKFVGAAGQVLLLGDCTGKNGTIQKTIRSAFFTASQV